MPGTIPSGRSNGSARAHVRAILLTLGVVAALELLRFTPFNIMAPAAVLLVVVAYAAFTGGLGPGLTSALLAIGYVAYDYSLPGQLFRYSAFDLNRLVVMTASAPAMALLVGILKRRAGLLDEEQSARKEAQAGEKRIAAILESITDAFLALDEEGRFTYANRRAETMLGRPRNQLIGKSIWSELPELGDADFRQVFERAVREHSTQELEHYYALLDHWFAVHMYPAESGVSVYLRDITEHRAAQNALRVSEAKFGGIVSIASDAIISIDGRQHIVLFNRGAEQIFGYTAAEAIGQPLSILLPQRFAASHERHVRGFGDAPVQARRMGERQQIAGRRKNGEEFPAEASISKLDLGGERIYTVVLRDISARVRVEQAQRFLAEAGAVLSASLNYDATVQALARLSVPMLGDGALVYTAMEGPDGPVRLAGGQIDPNQPTATGSLTDGPIENGAPAMVRDVVERGVAQLHAEIEGSVLDARASDGGGAVLQQAGARSVIVVPLLARGEAAGALLVFRTAGRPYDEDDLWLAEELAARAALALENARLYEQSQQAIRARDDVLSVVTHDLGNPLMAIRIGTGLLLRRVPPEERESGGWQHLEAIRASAAQMERLINNLLEVKRIEAGHLSMRRERHAVPPIIGEAIEMLAPLAEGKNIRLVSEVSGPLPPVFADRERMLQVFSNLMGNAIKFTPEGGRVAVGASAGRGEVVFSVDDTGPGIAAEHLPLVFERFWQAHRSGRQGIGLGLAIARGIVEAHGGRIWVESTVGRGTTFHFTVPTADASTGIPAAGAIR